MYALYRLVVGVLKFLIRLPLDLVIESLSFVREGVAPNLKDYIFISNLQNLERFTVSPGDLVMEQKYYDKIINQRSNTEPEIVIGTVIGYDIKWCKVLVAFFNPSEASRPIVRRYYEADLKVLKSSLNELFLQGKIYQAMEQAQQVYEGLEVEEDPLEDLLSSIKDKANKDDGNDDNEGGGGLVH